MMTFLLMAIMFRYAKRFFSARIYENSTEAISDIRTGSTVAIGGYMSAGVPEYLIKALKDYGNYDFTVLTMGCSTQNYGVNALISNKQVKKLITPYTGYIDINIQYFNGELEIDLVPAGTLAEKIRAAGAGIPGFWTTTGVGTLIEDGGFPQKLRKKGLGVLTQSEGKEKRIFNGVEHLYEEAIRAEYALVKAWKADTMGNLVYRRTGKNFNPEIAMNAKVTIAEVEEIVPAGALDPDEIDTPGIFVHRIIKGEKYTKPLVSKVSASDDSLGGTSAKYEEVSHRIAQRIAKELKPGMYVNISSGLPNLIPKYLEKGVIVASSSGIIGMTGGNSETDPDCVDAEGQPAWILEGGAVVSTNTIMDLLRGGHFDASVVGALEVSASGDLANWSIPGSYLRGIASGMDSVASKTTNLIVGMHHTHYGKPKIVTECALPLTGKRCVKLLITELGVFDFREHGLNLIELANGVTLEYIRSQTGCGFTISSDLKTSQ
jgi:3-oxoacid CoA-transferase